MSGFIRRLHTHLHYDVNVTEWHFSLFLGHAKQNPTI